ncbi:MAG: helix-turn-helix domain-containing protein [Candidatus Aegiribacteria sp.]|nr:helix-turn-helix domain-containing protein [Candidatus Aegiribacteria sp.]MBD3295318.1 helix-turn-helix domain-containing protein [Candidatus Fermentibacteria bacterium]
MMNVANVSQQLKERRIEMGLSIYDLARLADTSPATISRYENGWTRFEMVTLRKLAMALKCRLDVKLSACNRRTGDATTVHDIIMKLKRLFWDAEFSENTVRDHPVWVVERVLENGRLSDVHALQHLMGREHFLKCLQKATRLSTKTRVFWDGILRKEGMECTKKSFRRTAWNF